MSKRLVLLECLSLTLFLSACELSLAGDITPPPGAELSFEAGPTAPIEYPARPPDAENGAQIYVENCQACHGPGGLGDGEQAAQLPFSPAAIGDPELARTKSPDHWFRLVSSGNMDRYMPPFTGSLSVDERWDVLAHVYGLSADEDQMVRGEDLFLEHEEAFQSALLQPENLGELGAYSQQELAEELAAAAPLADDDAAALAAYLQSQALGFFIEPAESALEPERPTGEATSGENRTSTVGLEIYGTVANGSGEALPEGLQVILHGYDHTEEVVTQSTPVAADGSYRFEDLPLEAERLYLTSVDYAGLSYFSDFVNAETAGKSEELPLVVYETTTDASGLLIERLHLVFEFREEGQMRVIQLVAISNLGREAVIPQEDGQPVLTYALPGEASNLVFEQGVLGDRYVSAEEGFGDLRAVLPGSGRYQLLFAYDVPYSRSFNFELPLAFPAQSVAAFMADDGVQLESDVLAPTGSQQVDSAAYRVYQSTRQLETGENLELRLRGAHPLGSGFWLRLARNDALLVGSAALTVAVGAAWMWLRRQEAQLRSSTALLDAIVSLDQQFEAGDLPKNDYKRRRAALKEALRQALGREGQID